MPPTIRFTDDPSEALATAASFLELQPVRHNLLLTLLQQRAAQPEPGRYWVVESGGEAVGFALQSPLTYPVVLSAMGVDAAATLADAIADGGIDVPSVTGEAALAAAFAGRWTERRRCGAEPDQAQRIYQVTEVSLAPAAPGGLHQAWSGERDLLVEWFDAFAREAAELGGDVSGLVERRLGQGQLWLWDDGAPASAAGVSAPVAGVVRIGPVYTPPERRRSGYGSALVSALSIRALADGLGCMLYTDLANAGSNTIYRAIGYRAVAEVLRYRFR